MKVCKRRPLHMLEKSSNGGSNRINLNSPCSPPRRGLKKRQFLNVTPCKQKSSEVRSCFSSMAFKKQFSKKHQQKTRSHESMGTFDSHDNSSWKKYLKNNQMREPTNTSNENVRTKKDDCSNEEKNPKDYHHIVKTKLTNNSKNKARNSEDVAASTASTIGASSTPRKKSVFETLFYSLNKHKIDKRQSSDEDSSDDDIIVLPDDKNPQKFSFWDIKRCVKNIVHNMMMDKTTSVEDLDAVKIAQRMQCLYHQDFTSRLKAIELCLPQAKSKCAASSAQLKEVQPGLRIIDLETLEPAQWLNDVIINKYITLVVNAKPWACCLSSFFYEVLERRGKHSLPDDWFEKKYMLIPVCIGHHWSLLCAMPDECTVSIYNSMSSTDDEFQCAATVADYLESEYNLELDVETVWGVVAPEKLPRQQNEYDCGVYVCMFARKILFNLSPNINPSDVSFFRKWLHNELVSNRIQS